ncbi:MAG: DUF2817 domain-containing protein [Burkholderiales bacterium]
MAADFYSAGYAVARQRFREAAAKCSWWQAAYPIDAQGPHGELLSIDVAVSTRIPCKQSLVISSGLHGAEGLFGSAVQLAALSTIAAALAAEGVRLIFIHALNPYGFAWSRRVNEENVDLNRNFLSGEEPYAGSPEGYATLDSLLNPKSPPRWWDYVPLRGLPIIFRQGLPALKQIVAGGQYDYPRGLFFGGDGASNTARILSQHLSDWIGDSQRVLHLDLHTGLGRWATYRLLADERISSEWMAKLCASVDAQRIVQPASRSSDYLIRGGLGGWVRRRFAERDYLLLYAEFGTYDPIRILLGLRAENRAHHWGAPNEASSERAKHRLRELFCPASPTWRSRSLMQGLDLIRSVVRTLSGQS